MPDPVISLLAAALVAALLWLLFRPGPGLFWRWRASRETTARVRREDALKHLYSSEAERRPATLATLAGVLSISTGEAAELLDELITHRFARPQADGYVLTPGGRSYALQIVRAHRLWERYLADETEVREAEFHTLAEKVEHTLTPEEADALEARLGHPRFDPHGDPIPAADGTVAALEGMPLTRWPLDTPARITHLEDEPPEVYQQLLAEGLRLGEDVRILERTPARLRFEAGEKECVVASVVAANITVAAPPAEERVVGPFRRLSDLPEGETGTILGLDENCRGLTRRRLLDLGFTPGARVLVGSTGPFGDPRAYRIRGTLIALRSSQADLILLEPAAAGSGGGPGDGQREGPGGGAGGGQREGSGGGPEVSDG